MFFVYFFPLIFCSFIFFRLFLFVYSFSLIFCSFIFFRLFLFVYFLFVYFFFRLFLFVYFFSLIFCSLIFFRLFFFSDLYFPQMAFADLHPYPVTAQDKFLFFGSCSVTISNTNMHT